MRTPALLVSLGIAAVALAGCSDGGAEGPPDLDEERGSENGDDGASLPEGLTLLQVNTTPQEPIVVEESGTLGPQDAGTITVLGAEVARLEQRHDLTPHIPDGVAGRMRINVSWTPPDVGNGNVVYAYIESDRDAVISVSEREYDYEAGTSTMTAELQAGGSGSVELVAQRNYQADTSVDEDYDLTITMTPYMDRIPPQRVGAIEVPAGGQLWLDPVNGTAGRLVVYDGDDALHGDFEITERTRIADNLTTSQEFVLLPTEDLHARVLVAVPEEQPSPLLRHLPVSLHTGDAQDMPSGSGTMTFQTDLPPLRLGILLSGANGGLFVTSSTEYRVIDPDGEHHYTWTTTGLCGMCWFRGPFGDAAFTSGEYTVEYDSMALENAHFHEDITVYRR